MAGYGNDLGVLSRQLSNEGYLGNSTQDPNKMLQAVAGKSGNALDVGMAAPSMPTAPVPAFGALNPTANALQSTAATPPAAFGAMPSTPAAPSPTGAGNAPAAPVSPQFSDAMRGAGVNLGGQVPQLSFEDFLRTLQVGNGQIGPAGYGGVFGTAGQAHPTFLIGNGG